MGLKNVSVYIAFISLFGFRYFQLKNMKMRSIALPAI